jgi:hypothetical protein
LVQSKPLNCRSIRRNGEAVCFTTKHTKDTKFITKPGGRLSSDQNRASRWSSALVALASFVCLVVQKSRSPTRI